jgi:hypothetical protein
MTDIVESLGVGQRANELNGLHLHTAHGVG